MVTEYIFVSVIYPLADSDNRLSSWVSGLIWNTGFRQNSVTDSQVSNRYLSNTHNTNNFMRDTMLMKPTEKEEINIQYMSSDYNMTMGRSSMVWLPALLSICSFHLQCTFLYFSPVI